ncbi:hypothetical protein SISNIDRAFT_457444 [Sistotremastrum niveocremeum HHB9708]|uniref:Protein kinase domain-containing protein n=1 Tax=Sistotremastrum niveocremeum HHB9708 TaxID=1314777 RepID=A0A164RRQ3_9AGAM|nr:hypothetical protein SISNIDRAFT_457444 [Sistotremastrum niveocremeum HHB9708]
MASDTKSPIAVVAAAPQPGNSLVTSPTTSTAIQSPWWREKKMKRPWEDKPKRKKTVPTEQAEGLARTRTAVARAAKSVLGAALQLTHEALYISVDVLELAPVPGLAEVARTLLNIWDAVIEAETNRMMLLTLTQRCANILVAVREEIRLAGDEVSDVLQDPITKLAESFTLVETTVKNQVGKPFLKRYLQRDDDMVRIQICNTTLSDAVGLFGLSIQIRTLKQIQESDHDRRNEIDELKGTLRAASPPAYSPPSPSATIPLEGNLASSDVLASIVEFRKKQEERAQNADAEDLRQILRAALRAEDDATMIEVLQVGRDEWPDAVKTLQRRLEEEREKHSDGRIKGPEAEVDTVHREFLEGGIECLRRMSGNQLESLPHWTITKYEVDLGPLVGIGTFSDVYKGTWKGATVAIKILSPATPRDIYKHETQLWSALSHQNILPFLGASSTCGDPPWFLVSPYMSHGSLPIFLKKERNAVQRSVSSLVMMQEIANGMAYLHRKEILHGDLKGSNVLINDDYHCVIADFGQSKMKSEVFRISGQTLGERPGTVRWQAPELLAGHGELTQKVDVYAYAILCLEILSEGEVPWPDLENSTVRQLVLENQRPPIPSLQSPLPPLTQLIESCWAHDPGARPTFRSILDAPAFLNTGIPVLRDQSPSPFNRRPFNQFTHPPSPDPKPVPLPSFGSSQSIPVPIPLSQGARRATSPSGLGLSTSPLRSDAEATPRALSPAFNRSSSDPPQTINHVTYIPPSYSSSSSSSSQTPSRSSSQNDSQDTDSSRGWDGVGTPPATKSELVDMRRNERRYRVLLVHNFHPSLMLPLWTPSPVRVGSVGFLSKPSGSFHTFFNAFESVATMPSLYGYGRVTEGSQKQASRSTTVRAVDSVKGLFSKQPAVRRAAFPLRYGHKHAYLYTESTVYRYMDNLETPKRWFQSNVDTILRLYGTEFRLQREDILLVIGTLEAADFGIFVSHYHPDGQAFFDITSNRQSGSPWGSFSTAHTLPADITAGGPDWLPEDHGPSLNASKVSRIGDGANTLLLARLRFAPDQDEPTSQ